MAEKDSFNETIHEFVEFFKRLHDPAFKKEFDKNIDRLMNKWDEEDD